MSDEDLNVSETEIVAERSAPESISIRDALKKNLGPDEQDDPAGSPEEEVTEQDSQPEAQVSQQEEKPLLLPPADMRADEREAFLNPTPQNAHILQSYLNRRAYETRSDYSRRMQELEELKKETSSVYDTIRQYENEYARAGISLGDIAKRSVAWDQAMHEDPVNTALQWLESYGLTVQDLYGGPQGAVEQYEQPGYQETPQDYLTREEAEQIAEVRAKAILQDQENKAVEYYNQQIVQSFMSKKPVFRDPETASQLEADMAPVVAALTGTGRYSSPEEILETAYNYVINGNQAYSSLVQKMTAKPRILEQQQSVEKAKAAAKSISGSPGTGTPRIEAKDLRDNLRRRLMGGE
jgi:hypothetical protein